MQQKILVLEDDLALSAGLCFELDSAGYLTVAAYNCQKARQLLKGDYFDLALLDVNLPDGNGFDLCREIKVQKPELPVIFLTANDLERDVLSGFDMGAEDYVTKPFSMKILLKKIGVILKRSGEEQGRIFDDGFLRIDFTRARAEVNGQVCAVTPTEFRILQEFIAHRGQLLTYEVLLNRLWDGGSQFVDRHALAVNINRLRGKIEDKDHRYISNVYGMGYQWIGQ